MRKSFIFVFIIMLCFGCTQMKQWGILKEDGTINVDKGTAQDILLEQSVDTFGYTLGLMSAKDPELRKEVEYYYKQIKNNGVTILLINEIMRDFKSNEMAYQVLAYKFTSLISALGGTVAEDGTIASFGNLTDHYLEIGKNAYIAAIKNSEVK